MSDVGSSAAANAAAQPGCPALSLNANGAESSQTSVSPVDHERAQLSASAPTTAAAGAAVPTLPPTLAATASVPMSDVAEAAASVVPPAVPAARLSSSPAAAAVAAHSNAAPAAGAWSASSSSIPVTATAASSVISASDRFRSWFADMGAIASALDQHDVSQQRIAMLERELADANQRLAAQSAMRQGQLERAEIALAQITSSQQRVLQLERDLADANQRHAAEAAQAANQLVCIRHEADTTLAQLSAAQQRNRELQQRVAEMETQHAADRKKIADLLGKVKVEKLDALEQAGIATHGKKKAEVGKRKAETELQLEAEKRQRAEAAAASSAALSAAAAAQMASLQADKDQLENALPECPVCKDDPPSVVFAVAGCVHSVCAQCSAELVQRGDLACPICRAIVPADKRLLMK